MLHELRHTFHQINGRKGFDAYYAKLLNQGVSGVPTADEARKDYNRALSYRTYLA
jgi:hypothetical protein